jgi:hypothetical protein
MPANVVAVGSALAYFFQSKTSERTEASTFQWALWAERMKAYGSYSAALTEIRRGPAGLVQPPLGEPQSAATLEAPRESYRLRAALGLLSQVQLDAGDPALLLRRTRPANSLTLFTHARVVHQRAQGTRRQR